MRTTSSPVEPMAPGRRLDRKLGLRLATAAVLAPTFVLTMVVGRELFLLAVIGLTVAAGIEFFGMAEQKPYRARLVPGVALGLIFPLFFYQAPGDAALLIVVLTAGVVGVAAAQMLDPRGHEAIATVGFTLLGALYTGLLFGHQILVREISREIAGAPYWLGAILLAIPLLLTWANDTVAYFAGLSWGKRPLLSRVSPGKSIEGAVVALIATIALGVLAGSLVTRWFPPLGPVHGLAIGALVGVAAPCGDLIESAFKRDAGVKDASQIVPGHGGVLDRFDGMLITVPVFYYYLVGVVL